ncbi:MAG TPA: ABC transporter permease [Dehalococcoidia bacterium]|nr:ABC transporter permease [Dehalococcoidia bacterium]
MVRSLAGIAIAFVLFGLFLSLTGRNPLNAYLRFFGGTLGSAVGLSEVGVRMIPIILTGLGAAIPARIGLINVGAEGQLYIGAWAATGVALFSGIDQIWLMIPAMALAGFLGGALWGGLAIVLRSTRGVNEVISTLLLNFVAILLVNVFVFGPWKNSQGFGYPYTPDFGSAAILPAIGGTRLHLGLVLPVIAVVVVYLVLNRTSWGFNMRAIGGNDAASRRRGIPVARYLVLGMLVGAGVAGLAGMAEVSGIQHHLRPGISNNLGLLGFLASWLAGHNPLTLIGTSFLIAAIMVGGDLLQIGANLPSAATFILIGLVLFLVLGMRRKDLATP